ncbi:MAG TPA: hypothetical protein VM368_00165, partial [Flavisolibacter sp.]|nr:hypothetical protein [Flavisolibacter sp.]
SITLNIVFENEQKEIRMMKYEATRERVAFEQIFEPFNCTLSFGLSKRKVTSNNQLQMRERCWRKPLPARKKPGPCAWQEAGISSFRACNFLVQPFHT